jgi:integrase
VFIDMRTVKQRDLHGFRNWLFEFGLAEGTVDIYSRNVRLAYAEGGPLVRLRDDGLAPKTRRHILASCRRWAEYREDAKLTKSLRRLRLPPPRRKTAKIPLERDQLFALVDEIDGADYLGDAMRAQLGMMACRGFRCGDVLRLKRREIVNALGTGTLAYEAKGRRRIEFSVLGTYSRYLDIFMEYSSKWTRVEDLISPASQPGRRRRKAAAQASSRALIKCADALDIDNIHPHRLRRTYAVEYLRALQGDPEAVIKLQQHMQWATIATAMQYVDHARGAELDVAAETMWER